MSTDTAFTGSIPELYDTLMGPMMFEPFAVELASRFAGFSGDLLETAAGTGRVTRALAAAASPSARITATDLNEPMLARASAQVLGPNIEWRVADAQALPFADGAFDAMVCQFGVMFFPDKAAGYAEARRVLKPGGRYVFSVWDALEANDVSAVTSETVAARFPADPPSFFARIPFGWHDRDEIAAAVRAAGFAQVAVETVRLPTPAASATAAATGLCEGTPLRAEIEARDPSGLAATTQAVARTLADRFAGGDLAAAFEGRGQSVLVTATA